MQLDLLDWLIILSAVVAAVGGYRLGFVARALSWIGMAIGLILAIRFLPTVLRNAEKMSELDRLGVVVLLTLAGALLGQMMGLFAGSRLSSNLPLGNWRVADRVVGSGAGVFGVLVTLWLVLPTAANVPGWSAQQVRGSEIAQAIYDNAPSPPDAIETLRRLVGNNSFPSVFEGIQPAPDTGPAPGSVTMAQDVLARATAATVKVEGIACRRTQDGSGFALGPGLIATNAHVVAGEARTTVISADGEEHNAAVVAFDPGRDLAILRVPRYNVDPLPIGDATVGETGAVFGHPGGQDKVAVSPAAVRRQIVAVGRDLYDSQQTKREVLVLASQLAQGDSGGALVNDKGRVVGVAFAIAPDKPNTAYALSTSELKAIMDQPLDRPVDTGDCINN